MFLSFSLFVFFFFSFLVLHNLFLLLVFSSLRWHFGTEGTADGVCRFGDEGVVSRQDVVSGGRHQDLAGSSRPREMLVLLC